MTASYEVGYDYMILRLLNQCAWYLTWLDARQIGDTRTEQEALAVMTNVLPNPSETIPGYSADQDHPRIVQRERDIAARAQQGDASLVQQHVSVNCQPVYWTTTS